ncbi:hypothetical protein N9937_01930 [bacterium]|nr:hypothetical protein [bacterium]
MQIFNYTLLKTSKLDAYKDEIRTLRIKLHTAANSEYRITNPAIAEGKQITIQDLRHVVGGTNIYISDLQHQSIERHEVDAIIAKWTDIPDSAYIAKTRDCDDFASEMKGRFEQPSLSKYCFGMGISANHAFNWFVDSSRTLWIIEPQYRLDEGCIMSKAEAEANELNYHITKYWV